MLSPSGCRRSRRVSVLRMETHPGPAGTLIRPSATFSQGEKAKGATVGREAKRLRIRRSSGLRPLSPGRRRLVSAARRGVRAGARADEPTGPPNQTNAGPREPHYGFAATETGVPLSEVGLT